LILGPFVHQESSGRRKRISHKIIIYLGKSMAEYKYQPLTSPDSIRMLSRLGHDAHTYLFLSGDRFYSLPYYALSYTWGTQTEKIPITIDNSTFHITPNLHNALDSFFAENKFSCLWVDAICINQSDSEERDHQVRRMKTIYQRAEKVFIHLGDTPGTPRGMVAGLEDEDYHNILNTVKLIKYISALSKVMGLDWGVDVPMQDAFLSISRDPVVTNSVAWTQLRKLFQDSWFERLCKSHYISNLTFS
jgi:hypothetical protein